MKKHIPLLLALTVCIGMVGCGSAPSAGGLATSTSNIAKDQIASTTDGNGT